MNILEHDVLLHLFQQNYHLLVLSVFLLSFVLTYHFIPKVLWVSHEKRLMKEVNARSSHKGEVPSFGGIAFFIVLILFLSMFQTLRDLPTGNHLIIGMTFLFMAGLKDDLVVSTAKLKFVSQLFAASFLVFTPELHLSTLNGFFGITDIPFLVGSLINMLIVVALVNAYNMIDGADGVASIVGIVISMTYAVSFYLTNQPYYVLVSLTLVGLLSAFLRFNLCHGSKKMFMGDSGSLVVGFMIAFLTLKVLVVHQVETSLNINMIFIHRFIFAFAVLFIPVFDTSRVIVLRLYQKKSPFNADRNHLHHVLLDCGLSHKQTGLTLGAVNILVILSFFISSYFFDQLGVIISMLLVIAIVTFVFEKLKHRHSKNLGKVNA